MPATWGPEQVEQFTEYLRNLMRQAGIPDFAALSRLTGVNQSQFSNWTRGKTRPSRENLKRISPALGLKSPAVLYLVSGLDEPGDHDLEVAPDFSTLPQPFQELRSLYERLDAHGHGDIALEAIRLVLPALQVKLDDIERPPPNGRRKRPA